MSTDACASEQFHRQCVTLRGAPAGWRSGSASPRPQTAWPASGRSGCGGPPPAPGTAASAAPCGSTRIWFSTSMTTLLSLLHPEPMRQIALSHDGLACGNCCSLLREHVRLSSGVARVTRRTESANPGAHLYRCCACLFCSCCFGLRLVFSCSRRCNTSSLAAAAVARATPLRAPRVLRPPRCSREALSLQ